MGWISFLLNYFISSIYIGEIWGYNLLIHLSYPSIHALHHPILPSLIPQRDQWSCGIERRHLRFFYLVLNITKYCNQRFEIELNQWNEMYGIRCTVAAYLVYSSLAVVCLLSHFYGSNCILQMYRSLRKLVSNLKKPAFKNVWAKVQHFKILHLYILGSLPFKRILFCEPWIFARAQRVYINPCNL